MLSRLGFPSVREHRRFVTAIGVDAVGTGVFMPVSVLYFLVATPLTLVQVGGALSLAALLALPVGPLVGGVVDRFGAKRVLQAANLAQAAAFVAYLFVDSFLGVTLATLLATGGRNAFWGSYGATVALITRRGERELWFGFLGALRNVGFALGGLLAGAAITIGTGEAYAAIVVANASSYLLSWVLLRSVPDVVPARTRTASERGSWAEVLRDRPYRVLVLTQATYSMALMALNYAMPVYVTEVLDLPGWVAGALFTVNTVMCGFGQGLLIRSLTGRVRRAVLLAANAAFGLSFLVLYGADAAPVAAAIVLVLAGVAVFTLGEMLAGPVLVALAAESAPDHLRGRYLAYHQTAWTITGAIAPVTLAWLLVQGAGATWLGLAGLAVVGVVCSAWLGHVLPRARRPISNRAEDVEQAAEHVVEQPPAPPTATDATAPA